MQSCKYLARSSPSDLCATYNVAQPVRLISGYFLIIFCRLLPLTPTSDWPPGTTPLPPAIALRYTSPGPVQSSCQNFPEASCACCPRPAAPSTVPQPLTIAEPPSPVVRPSA